LCNGGHTWSTIKAHMHDVHPKNGEKAGRVTCESTPKAVLEFAKLKKALYGTL